MNAMPMTYSATTAMMSAAMMVAMMLPSLAAAVWHYRRDLRALQTSDVHARTMLFAAGYASVWGVVGLLLFAVSAWTPPTAGLPPTFSSLLVGAVVLSCGALQRSRWKARQLARCQGSAVSSLAEGNVMTPWNDGCWFGVRCTVSCAALMTVLLVAGLMNTTIMLLVTAAITAERLVPAGVRIARLTGTITIVAGAIICLQSRTFARQFHCAIGPHVGNPLNAAVESAVRHFVGKQSAWARGRSRA